MDISDVLYMAGLLVPTHLRNIKDGCSLMTSISLYHNVSKLLLCWTTQKYGWSSHMYIPNGFVNGRIACTFAFTHIHDGYLLMHDCSNMTAIQQLACTKNYPKCCSVGLPRECCWNSHLYMLAGFVNGRIACTCPFTYISDGYLLMHDCSNVTAIQHLACIKQPSRFLLFWNFLLLYCERNTK